MLSQKENHGSAAEYVAIHRIAVACTSCRRKKARCTGGRPSCTNCRRLGIDCIYPDIPAKGPNIDAESRMAAKKSDANLEESLSSRLSSIERTLQNFGSQLQSVRSDLAFLTGRERPAPETSNTAQPPPKRQRTTAPLPCLDSQGTSVKEIAPIAEDTAISREMVADAVDAYFSYSHNQPYSFFHEETFRLQLSRGLVPRHVLLAVLAVSIRFLPNLSANTNLHDVSVGYANQSWKSVVADCFATSQRPDISLVQTVSLLGWFDFTAGKSRYAAAWVKTGLAVRIAQELGLMQDPTSDLPRSSQEERRRVFWSVYLLDRLVSCGRGRPHAVLDASCHLRFPCTEQEWRDGLPGTSLTLDELMTRSVSTHETLGPFAQTIAVASVLGRSTQYSLQQFNIRSRCPPWDPRSDFAALESDLLHLESLFGLQVAIEDARHLYVVSTGTIDQPRISPVILCRIFYHLCYCLLNHPFLLRQRIGSGQSAAPVSFLARAFNTGWQHASQMIELVKSVRQDGFTFTTSFSGYCVLVAGSIIALHKHSEDPAIKARAGSLLHDTFSFLEAMGKIWNNAQNMTPCLRLLIERSLDIWQLSSTQQIIPELETKDLELLWTIVDYGAISNKAPADFEQDRQEEADLWFESFFDLFGIPGDGTVLEQLDSTIDPFATVPM